MAEKKSNFILNIYYTEKMRVNNNLIKLLT